MKKEKFLQSFKPEQLAIGLSEAQFIQIMLYASGVLTGEKRSRATNASRINTVVSILQAPPPLRMSKGNVQSVLKDAGTDGKALFDTLVALSIEERRALMGIDLGGGEGGPTGKARKGDGNAAAASAASAAASAASAAAAATSAKATAHKKEDPKKIVIMEYRRFAQGNDAFKLGCFVFSPATYHIKEHLMSVVVGVLLRIYLIARDSPPAPFLQAPRLQMERQRKGLDRHFWR